MPRACTACSHPERRAIDAALVSGEPFRKTAERFGTSTTALHRHKSEHLPVTLSKAREAEEVAYAGDLLEEVRSLQKRALGILDKAEASGELRIALSAIREVRGNLELLAKLLGELDDRPVVNILVSQEWLQLRTVLVSALEPYPDAHEDVLKALELDTSA